MCQSECLRHGYGHREPARFERASRQPRFIFHEDIATSKMERGARQRYDWRYGFSETNDIPGSTHRKEFPPSPEVLRPFRKIFFRQGVPHARQILSHEERLASFRKVVRSIGFISLTCPGTFEMGDKGGAFGCEIGMDLQGSARVQAHGKWCDAS